MHLSRFSRRRRQLGAVIAGLCVAAGSVGSIALADSGSGTSVSVEASVMVQAGMSPLNAQQAAANLNAAIDSAAQTIARAAASSIPAGRPVRTTAAATKAFASEVDAALCEFVVQTVAGLKAAGVSTGNLLTGTLAALKAVVRTIPGAVAFTTGAEFAVAGGSNGATVSASLNPTIDTAIRSDHSRLGPCHPARPAFDPHDGAGRGRRRAPDRGRLGGGRGPHDPVDRQPDGRRGRRELHHPGRHAHGGRQRRRRSERTVIAAVDATLDSLSDVNIVAAVDASLSASAG